MKMARKGERKLTAREKSAQEAKEKREQERKRAVMIDRALDGRNDAKTLAKAFPEVADVFERKVARYDRFLAKVSAGE
jgi:hypothetical protein